MKFCHHVLTGRISGRQSKVGCNTRRGFQYAGRSTMDHNITSEQHMLQRFNIWHQCHNNSWTKNI